MAQVIGEGATFLARLGLHSGAEGLAFADLLRALGYAGPASPTDACFDPRSGG